MRLLVRSTSPGLLLALSELKPLGPGLAATDADERAPEVLQQLVARDVAKYRALLADDKK